jgi:dephospho-CoA kinase
LKVIGITGGTGSGKTSVLRMMERLGCFAIDADEVYHRLLRENEQLIKELKKEFPEAFHDDKLSRKKLGDIVYNDPEKMQTLTAITHPYVIKDINRILYIGEEHNASMAVIDAIFLIESGLDKICDLVIGVVAPREVRMERIMKRDNISREQALRRINAQPDEQFYYDRCDYIIKNNENDGTILSKTVYFYDKLTRGLISKKNTQETNN